MELFKPTPPDAHFARWRIDGHKAVVLIWTVDEWDRLSERPADAQYYPCGVWCALRLEEDAALAPG